MPVEAGELAPGVAVEVEAKQATEAVDEKSAGKSLTLAESSKSNLRTPHRFKAGEVANPAGRPKVVREIAVLAREYTTQAIETLAEIMRNKRTQSSARVRAAEILLDRGYGKAQQTVNLIQHFGSKELEEAARAILRKRDRVASMQEARIIEAEVVEPEKK